MTKSFSFGFENDDTEDNDDDIMEPGASHDTPGNRYLAATEPKLHKLQDLVWNIALHSLVFASLPYSVSLFWTTTSVYHPALGCTATFTMLKSLVSSRSMISCCTYDTCDSLPMSYPLLFKSP